jgi:hypothetical protein
MYTSEINTTGNGTIVFILSYRRGLYPLQIFIILLGYLLFLGLFIQDVLKILQRKTDIQLINRRRCETGHVPFSTTSVTSGLVKENDRMLQLGGSGLSLRPPKCKV